MQFSQNYMSDQTVRQRRMLTQRKRDILKYIEIGQQSAILKQHAESSPQRVKLGLVKGGYIHAVNIDSAMLRDELPCNEPQ